MINVTVAQKRIQESLVGFPERVTEAYLAFAEHEDMNSLDVAVLGVLQFYLAKKPTESLDSLPGTTRLVEDLGCDSLTMMDTVFMVETLLEIKIIDTELARMATLDDLRGYIRHRVKSGATTAA
jgi:acyl carrier protein